MSTYGLREIYEKQGMSVGWDPKTQNVTINGKVVTPELLQATGFQLNDGRWETNNSTGFQVVNNVTGAFKPAPAPTPVREIQGGGIAAPVAAPEVKASSSPVYYNTPAPSLDNFTPYVPTPAPSQPPNLGDLVAPPPEPVIPVPDPEPAGGSGKTFEEDKPRRKKDEETEKNRTPIGPSPVQNQFGMMTYPSNASIFTGRGSFLGKA